jgi:UDPglucose--hexose-1-phosphate uridylyltransferase
MVPRDIQDEISGAKQYYAGAGRCIYCDIAAEELRDRARLVLEDEKFLVFCPFASRFAYETWILPREHQAFFESQPEENYAGLARVLREALIRLDRGVGDPPFNYIIHSSPFAQSSEGYYHWHLEILPKLGQVAGFEWGSGWYINTVPPEHAARTLAETSA